MPMTDPRELFLHELGDILYAERQILKRLPKLAKEAGDDRLRDGFRKHEGETREQVRNLEQAFELLGESVSAEQCPGIDGIIGEHDEFVQEEKPRAGVRDLFLTGSALRVEHYEIAAYTSLVSQAQAMKERDVARLLRENLRQEKAMAREVERLGKELGREVVGSAA